MKPRRVGILTGGGDCPGLNAVIRVVAKSLMHRYDARIVGVLDGFEGLVENKARELTYDEVSGIAGRGGTILGTSNRADPFNYKDLGDRSAEAMRHYRKLRLDALIVVGGDGSMGLAAHFARLGAEIVGVPKTIDNDVWGTDATIGFNSAVTVAANAIEAIHSTADAHRRIMVIEVMGRHAGWIALYSGVAGGADVILIPEHPFDFTKIGAYIRERHKHRRFTIVVVAEGAKPRGGDQVVQRIVKCSPEAIRLGGISHVVAGELEKITGTETRVTILGHLLRSGAPSPTDRLLAAEFGLAAVDFIEAERFGELVVMRHGKIQGVPIDKVAGKIRTVSDDDPMMRVARDIGTELG